MMMKSNELDQQQIVEGLKALDPAVIDDFVDQYSRPLFGVILNYTRNPSDAEEILQDTLLKIIKKIETFREESDIWPWMHVVAQAPIQAGEDNCPRGSPSALFKRW
ncbi:MAG: sigma factor [Acidobacteriota bacterium]